MWSWSIRKKIIVIFAAAMLIRLAALVSFEGERGLIFWDSKHYIQVAQNLLERGVYSMESQDPQSDNFTGLDPQSDNFTGQDLRPDSFRTPVLPFLLIPFLYFKLSLYWVALMNDILMSLAAVALFLLGRRLFNEKAAFIAAILSGLEPYGALISNQILTEAPFTLIFILSLLLLALYIKEQKVKNLYLGSLLLAVSALTRPVAFPLFILIPIAILLEKFTKKLDEAGGILKKQKMPWKKLTISLLIFIAVVSPWLAFNRLVLKIWSLSTMTNFGLYMKAEYFNEWLIENGKIAAGGPDILHDIKEENFWSPKRTSEYFNTAKDFIMKRPLEYASFMISRLYPLLSYADYETIANGIGAGGSKRLIDRFKSDLLKLNMTTAAKTLKTEPGIMLMLAGELFFAIVSILALLNLFIHIRKKTRDPYYHLFFFITLIIYCLLISPEWSPRYRIPINPILFLLAIDSLIILADNIRRKTISRAPQQI